MYCANLIGGSATCFKHEHQEELLVWLSRLAHLLHQMPKKQIDFEELDLLLVLQKSYARVCFFATQADATKLANIRHSPFSSVSSALVRVILGMVLTLSI